MCEYGPPDVKSRALSCWGSRGGLREMDRAGNSQKLKFRRPLCYYKSLVTFRNRVGNRLSALNSDGLHRIRVRGERIDTGGYRRHLYPHQEDVSPGFRGILECGEAWAWPIRGLLLLFVSGPLGCFCQCPRHWCRQLVGTSDEWWRLHRSGQFLFPIHNAGMCVCVYGL